MYNLFLSAGERLGEADPTGDMPIVRGSCLAICYDVRNLRNLEFQPPWYRVDQAILHRHREVMV